MRLRSLRSGSDISPCGTWRYTLWRRWADGGTCCFVLLNPSTADATANDPTIERCQRRAIQWGFGRLVVVNLFAYRATDPPHMKAAADPVGPGNDAAIMREATAANLVVCGWGTHGEFRQRDTQVRTLLGHLPLTALHITARGHPAHPLYLPYHLTPLAWSGTRYMRRTSFHAAPS